MLNPIEKILLSLASIVLSNRYSRNLFVVYAMGLHFIVLVTLYSWTTEEAIQAGVKVIAPKVGFGGP